jgi:hypothetical protein
VVGHSSRGLDGLLLRGVLDGSVRGAYLLCLGLLFLQDVGAHGEGLGVAGVAFPLGEWHVSDLVLVDMLATVDIVVNRIQALEDGRRDLVIIVHFWN